MPPAILSVNVIPIKPVDCTYRIRTKSPLHSVTYFDFVAPFVTEFVFSMKLVNVFDTIKNFIGFLHKGSIGMKALFSDRWKMFYVSHVAY
jgi:hypothetical protein